MGTVIVSLYVIGVFLIAMGSISDDGDTILVGIWIHIAATVFATIKMMGGLF